jgi:predicted dehydrogenase
MAMTNHLEEKAICHKDDHSAHKMLRIGHRAYHEISSMFWLKVIYKLQYYSDNIIRNCMSQFDTIFNKFSIMKGRCFALQSSRRLKVGVIGLGNWGGQYLGFLTSSKYYELVVAYDSDVQHLNKLSKKYGILPAQNVEELCENYQVEAIFILTPTPTHYEVYQSVLKYGLPVYMEKPISQDLRSAQSMMNSSVKTDGMLYIAHSMKYEPVIQKIKILLENDTLGNIKSFEITRSVKYKNIDYYEEAALYQIGVHIIDIILFLFGEVESIISREHVDCNNRNYDHVHIRMCNGFDGKMHFGFSSVYNFHVRIIGSKATLTYADSKMTIYGDEEKMVTIEPMLHEKTVFKQLEEFFLAVRDQRKYLNTVENAMSIMKICSEITKEISHENRYDYASDS